ncbi:MAG: hypothetical protein ACYDGM_02770 [Vulcanimicrobiaceae bacterium]
MTAQPWETPIARLEGAFEQVSKRLDSIDRRLDGVDKRFDSMDRRFDSMDRRFSGMDRKIDENFRATIGWMLGQTAVLLAALAAIAYTLHH